MDILLFSEAKRLLRLGCVVLEHVVGMQLAVQLVLVGLTVQGSLCWIELALSNGDSWPQVVDQSCVVGHADRANHDVLVLDEGDQGACVVHRGCFIALCPLGDLADVLTSKIVVDLVKLITPVLLIVDDDDAHVFSWEDQFVTQLVLLSDQLLHVLLSDADLGGHVTLWHLENGLIRVQW